MTKNAALLLAPGFEEAEAIIVLDILERLGISVKKISCSDEKHIQSYHDVGIVADTLLREQFDNYFDAVIIPGGPKGTVNLSENTLVIDFIEKHDRLGKLICPICSAAAKVLAPHGLLKGRRYVCSGTLSEGVTDGIYVDAPVVRDGNLISGQGLGAAFDFAFNLAGILTLDYERTFRQAEHINYKLTLIENS
ncbi:DJ-1/PfpI family protein [Citrobacter sp. Cb031]|uniref:DJ-1/PfpI family protein n=1 Tax=Citrobacter sp. Cb031 TaxID=2985025 RepID=UPI0025802C00|nr:DJ-1/PfpI family protein [Citrobacter sp. Cb031]MDM3464459.1 DJ-1/PfpI family protein [Citrobacter sp. Cb031]